MDSIQIAFLGAVFGILVAGVIAFIMFRLSIKSKTKKLDWDTLAVIKDDCLLIENLEDAEEMLQILSDLEQSNKDSPLLPRLVLVRKLVETLILDLKANRDSK